MRRLLPVLLACAFGGPAGAQVPPVAVRPPPVAQAPIVVPPPTIDVPAAPRPPVLLPPAPPLAIERPPVITACDAGGCWDSNGRRLNSAGPVLLGPQGACTTAGAVVRCP